MCGFTQPVKLLCLTPDQMSKRAVITKNLDKYPKLQMDKTFYPRKTLNSQYQHTGKKRNQKKRAERRAYVEAKFKKDSTLRSFNGQT